MMTGMADTVGVDASAPAAGGAPQEDPLVIAGRAMRSRLLLGTGGFPSLELLSQAIAAAGSDGWAVAARGGFRRQNRSGHLGDRDPGRRGQLGELAGGLGRGQAEALHERAAGHRDDRVPCGRGPDLVQDPPLVLDDRGQPQPVVFAAGHDYSPPRTAYRYSINAHKPSQPGTSSAYRGRRPPRRTGFSHLCPATDVRSGP